MAKKRETRRQQKIQRALRKEYGKNIWMMKVHGGPFQKDGVGDLLGVVFGIGFMFEVKEPDGTASEIQLETIEDFRTAGGIGAVILEADEAIELINERCGVNRFVARTATRRSVRSKPRRQRTLL